MVIISEVCNSLAKHEIIGLGEATHGSYKNSVMRFKIIKLLVEKYSIREIVIEDDVKIVNKIMIDDGVHLQQIMPYLMHPWDNKIMEEMLLYIINWNKNNPDDKVRVYGVDIIKQGAVPFKHKIAASLNKSYESYSINMYDTTLNERQHIALRDKVMAALFEEQHVPGVSCVMIFHNAHLNHSGYQKAMGYYIKQKFGTKYFAVANSFIRGSYSGWFYGDKENLPSEYQVISVNKEDSIYNAKSPTFFSPPPAKYIWLPDSYVDKRDPYKFFYKKNTNGFDAVLLINDETPLHSYKEN
jgi:erythromycin esterase-like protein